MRALRKGASVSRARREDIPLSCGLSEKRHLGFQDAAVDADTGVDQERDGVLGPAGMLRIERIAEQADVA